MRIQSGDTVVVITGKNRGKTGRILRTFPSEQRVVVEGVAMQKKHMKARGALPAGIIEREGRIHVSNVMLVCPQSGKRTRVGYRITASGTKERFSKKSGQGIVLEAKEAAKKKR